MHLTSGLLQGLPLVSFGGGASIQGQRPTSEKLRNALVQIVKSRFYSLFEDSFLLKKFHVVDLCAGTGAVGCEWASLGCDHVTWVEQDSKVVSLLKTNALRVFQGLKKQGKEPSALPRLDLIEENCLEAYQSLDQADLIFLDPPYLQSDLYEQILSLEVQHHRMNSGGLFVLEMNTKNVVPFLSTLEKRKQSFWINFFIWNDSEDVYSYGDSSFVILTRK